MSLGIDFVLRGDSGAFTRAMARANNSIKDVRKEIREAEIGRGPGRYIKEAFGVAGIIEAFKVAIDNAKEVRNQLESWGRPVDAATQSVADFGDSLDKTVKGAKDGATWILSFATRAGEGWGSLINRMRGINREQEINREAAAKGADENIKAANKAREKEFGVDAVKEAKKRSIKSAEDAEFKGLSEPEAQLGALLKKRAMLSAKLNNAPKDAKGNFGVSFFATKEEMDNLDADIKARSQAILKAASDADREFIEKRRADIQEKFMPSVEQLAEMQVGTMVSGSDPRLKARKILELESQAAQLTGSGRFKEGLFKADQAQKMREGLSDITGKGTALTAENAESAFQSALKETNNEIGELRKAVNGIIRAQP